MNIKIICFLSSLFGFYMAIAASESLPHYGPPALFGCISDFRPKNWPSSLTYLTSKPLPESLLNQFKKDNLILAKNLSEIVEIRPAMQKHMGMGVFAKNKLPLGTVIGCYTGEIVKKPKFGVIQNQYLMKFFDDWYIDPQNSGNETRFVNHSFNPNVEVVNYDLSSKGNKNHVVVLVLLRDIQKDEELFINYGDEYWGNKFTVFLKKNQELLHQLMDLKQPNIEITDRMLQDFAFNIYINFYKTGNFIGTPEECLQYYVTQKKSDCSDILSALQKLHESKK